MPVLDEAAGITTALRALGADARAHGDEVIVVDGGSADAQRRTRASAGAIACSPRRAAAPRR
jgi:glycosyltransferase involved in cell wall biosynthesis